MKLFKLPLYFWCNMFGEIRKMPQWVNASLFLALWAFFLGGGIKIATFSWKGCFAVFKVKVTVKVRNSSECLPGQYLWSVKLSMVMYHHQPEYRHSEISFYDVQATIVSTRSSEILKLLQSRLVWWYIIAWQGKTPWKDFLAFTQGVREIIWLGGLWTRLLPLLASPISKAGVSTGSSQENVERTLLL